MTTAETKLEAPVRVALVSGARAPYDMFDLDGADATSLRLRGPLMLEVGEEVSLRVERGNQSAVVRARVTGHARNGHGDVVTTMSYVGDGAAVRRLIGAPGA